MQDMIKKLSYRHTTLACYLDFAYQGIVNNFPPLLFVIFQKTWNISLLQITFLISLNFIIQFLVDIFSIFFVEKIPYRLLALASSAFTFTGLISLVILPNFLTDSYIGLCIAIVLNGLGGGLIDVIGSPIIEGLPNENKSGSMSLLHSIYCWGSVVAILITTGCLVLFGYQSWMALSCGFALIPLTSFLLFLKVPILQLTNEEDEDHIPLSKLLRRKFFYVFLLLIMIGGATEMAISQWSSYFAEIALGVPKATGDVLGPCLLLFTMAITRTWLGTKAKKIRLDRVLLFSSVICLVSVLVIISSPSALGSLLAWFWSWFLMAGYSFIS